MSDTYPRVRWLRSPVPQESFPVDEFGNSKVVPADAIVIERDSLPTVVDDGESLIAGRTRTTKGLFWGDPALVREERRLREDAALVIYLREHPPVDEREIKALHRLIGSEADATNDALARRLLATGKVHVDVEDGAL